MGAFSTTGSWRDAARPIIAGVIARVGTDDLRALRAELRKAFPWGERKYHPYKIWLGEVRVQLKLKRVVVRSMTRAHANPDQGELF